MVGESEREGSSDGTLEGRLDVVLFWEVLHELLVRPAERVADDVVRLSAVLERQAKAPVELRPPGRADLREAAVERSLVVLPLHRLKLARREHDDLFDGFGLGLSVGVFDDPVAKRLHHFRETKGFAGKGTVGSREIRNRVKRADEVQGLCHVSFVYRSKGEALIESRNPRERSRSSLRWHLTGDEAVALFRAGK